MITSSEGLSDGPLLTFSVEWGGDEIMREGQNGKKRRTDLVDDIQTLNDTAEDDVSAIQPGGLDGGDEELRA